jgi:arylsulfatase A-like enzyme
MRRFLAAGVAAVLAAGLLAGPARAAGKPLTMVFIVDGLRPDSVNPADTPNLWRMRNEGVWFANSHSVVPTVTRGNATVIGSGALPARSGILGNAMYVPAVNPTAAFSTGDANQLYKLDDVTGGKIILVKSLGERLQAAGLKIATLGSGTSGASLLLNPRSKQGVGTMVNTGDAGAPFSWPAAVEGEIKSRFGNPPSTSGQPNANVLVSYAEKVVREYLLSADSPDVLLNWITEPDGSQHANGVGSPQALSGIRNSDKELGLVVDAARALGRRVNVIVASDHGFNLKDYNVNVDAALVAAGLRTPGTDDVVVSNTGPALINVKNRDPQKIEAIVRFLQTQPWASTIYTAAERPVGGAYVVSPGDTDSRTVKPFGFVPGTFSLELIHQSNPVRGADIIVTFPWSSLPNPYGVPGRAAFAGGGTTGPTNPPASEHGSFSPWDTHNTLLAWGDDIRSGVVSDVPAGNVDIAPTVMKLAGASDSEINDGRVLTEALTGGAVAGHSFGTQVFSTQSGGKDSKVQVSSVDGKWYIDKAWADDTQPFAANGAGEAGGSVPSTLSLTLGPAASFGAFAPGVTKEYSAQTTAGVTSTAGDAALSFSDPGHLTNGAFSLPSPLVVELSKSAWAGPASNDAVAIGFRQHIDAGDALRTGAYSKTLTFTLSTTNP